MCEQVMLINSALKTAIADGNEEMAAYLMGYLERTRLDYKSE